MTVMSGSNDFERSIVGTLSWMAPEMLQMYHEQQTTSDEQGPPPSLEADLLIANDSFGCGCCIAYLCSDGLHPFAHPVFPSLSDNILLNRRMALTKLKIADARHVELVDNLTKKDPQKRWTIKVAILRSHVFETTEPVVDALVDAIQLHRKPEGTCLEQLLSAALVTAYPLLPSMVGATTEDAVDDAVDGGYERPTIKKVRCALKRP